MLSTVVTSDYNDWQCLDCIQVISLLLKQIAALSNCCGLMGGILPACHVFLQEKNRIWNSFDISLAIAYSYTTHN